MKRMFWCEINTTYDCELSTLYDECDEEICKETTEYFMGTGKIFLKKVLNRPKPWKDFDNYDTLELTVIHGFTYDSDEETDIEERKKEIREAARNEVIPVFAERASELRKSYNKLMGE